MNRIDEIINLTKEYKVITFDVFDTLIIRDVKKPTDVFKFSYGFLGRYIRVLAEIISRKISKTGEVTLKDIQKFFPFNIERELSFEFKFCRANPQIYDLYRKLIDDGKIIYAISDMYLDSLTISNILKNNGYDIPVIVSSEEGKSKKTGDLFSAFLDKYNYSNDEILHIGDNYDSDVAGANKAGIKSIHIAKHKNELSYTSIRNYNTELACFINHGLNNLADPVEKIGYEIVGPIILSFCQWIHKKYLEEKFDCLYFLARDMQFTFDVYKDIYKEDNIKYLYVSRKSFLFSREHPEEMIKYLKKEGCFGNAAIVDTGWLGNAQVEIEKYSKMIDEKSDIGGLYLGIKLTSKLIKRSNRSYCGLFPDSFGQFQCELFPPFMETLIGSNGKQVIKYENGFPVFDREENRDKTNSIKSGARRFISEWCSYKENKPIDGKIARKAFIKMFRYPKDEHISLIGNLHYEDFKDTSIVSYDDKYPYRRDIKKWLSDLSYSGWKGAYFKKSFVKMYKFFLFIYLILNSIRNITVDINKIRNNKL